MPSLREIWMSRFFTPIVTMSSRFAPLVRSPLIAMNVSPRSIDLNTLLAGA